VQVTGYQEECVMRKSIYAVKLRPDKDSGFVVRFRDLPEAQPNVASAW